MELTVYTVQPKWLFPSIAGPASGLHLEDFEVIFNLHPILTGVRDLCVEFNQTPVPNHLKTRFHGRIRGCRAMGP